MPTVTRFFAAALLIGVVAACGGGTEGDGADGTNEVPIEITAEGIEAPDRPEIPLGSTVSLVFTAFELDDAHLHGYDIWTEVGPDSDENLIEFVADQPGIFLVELEKEFAYITELVVQ
jgi:hypothetical protein